MNRQDLPEHERRRVTDDELRIANHYGWPDFWWWKKPPENFGKPMKVKEPPQTGGRPKAF